MPLTTTDLNRILEVAVVAARLAGQRAMEMIATVHPDIKNGNEMVTQADRICQDLIIARIKENYPDHGFIGEEGDTGQIFKQPPRSSQPFWWIIDPIDGTNNYAHKMLSFTVSIGVMYEGRPVVGVIFEPATETMFPAYADGPATCNGSRMSTTEENISEFSSIAVDSNFTNGIIPQPVINLMTRTRFRNLGTTALHLAYVAKGSLIGMIVTSPKLWDIAAGALIVERAGGLLTDWQGNSVFPIDTANYTGKKFDIISANKTTHKEIVESLKNT